MAKARRETAKPVCGIVMPISAIGEYQESHWVDVLAIIEESAKSAGFAPSLVSNAEDIGIIHERIIKNLYENPIVVCDVSAKNPNVMFELGLRLAFDKPTIVIKDDKTSYSFDTSPIEHLTYPKDLRYGTIEEFKEKLAEKIEATHEKSKKDPNYTTFLKHFGKFKVAKLEVKNVSGEDYIVTTLERLTAQIDALRDGQMLRPVLSGGGPSMPTHSRIIKVDGGVSTRRLIGLLSRVGLGDAVSDIEKIDDGYVVKLRYFGNESVPRSFPMRVKRLLELAARARKESP